LLGGRLFVLLMCACVLHLQRRSDDVAMMGIDDNASLFVLCCYLLLLEFFVKYDEHGGLLYLN